MIREWSIVSNETSKVKMVILWDGIAQYDPPENTTLYEGYFPVGWIRNADGTFSEPPPAPPEPQDA